MSKEVKRYDALRDSAKKATPGPWRIEDDEDSAAGAVYITQDTPDWREPIARLYGWHDQNYLELADPTTILGLLAERDALLAERDAAQKDAERAWMRVKELDLLFGRYLLAMKAAVIDADQRGDEEGMQWIYNSLEGPGELPPENEPNAQAFFDREIKPINDGMAELFAALRGEQP